MVSLRPGTDNYYMFQANADSPDMGQFALVDEIADQGRNHAIKLVAFGIYGVYRGKGYGQQMLREAIEEANRIRGNRRLFLWVMRNNTKAIHIYEKHGFKITDECGQNAWEMTYVGDRLNSNDQEYLR